MQKFKQINIAEEVAVWKPKEDSNRSHILNDLTLNISNEKIDTMYPFVCHRLYFILFYFLFSFSI